MRFFASLREAAGCDRVTIDASTAGDAVRAAAERFGPAFAQIAARCAVVVGDDHVARSALDARAVGSTDEIALLPPVSGGQMVDVGDKGETQREATAGCRLRTTEEMAARILRGDLPKGDPVAAARIAGILAVKRTPDLIPLCHPVRTTSATVTVEATDDPGTLAITAMVRGIDRTGFEMEALMATAIAALTIYDMSKGLDPAIAIEDLRMLAKSGGKSGTVTFA
jgi:cyclic pyranopterin monophosphate synthase